jgi:hypothetical protein
VGDSAGVVVACTKGWEKKILTFQPGNTHHHDEPTKPGLPSSLCCASADDQANPEQDQHEERHAIDGFILDSYSGQFSSLCVGQQG